jgi:hypothetical protein
MNESHGTGETPDRGAQHVGTVATENPSGGLAGGRKEVGGAESSRRDPPHVTVNAKDAPAQKDIEGAGDAPVPPANASGRDRFSEREHDQPIDPASEYARRPEEDKNREPGGRE